MNSYVRTYCSRSTGHRCVWHDEVSRAHRSHRTEPRRFAGDSLRRACSSAIFPNDAIFFVTSTLPSHVAFIAVHITASQLLPALRSFKKFFLSALVNAIVQHTLSYNIIELDRIPLLSFDARVANARHQPAGTLLCLVGFVLVG